MTTENKSITELKKGDIVIFYGHRFTVTEDASETNHVSGSGVFFAPCVIVEKFDGLNSDILNRYNGFQGNKSVSFLVEL